MYFECFLYCVILIVHKCQGSFFEVKFSLASKHLDEKHSVQIHRPKCFEFFVCVGLFNTQMNEYYCAVIALLSWLVHTFKYYTLFVFDSFVLKNRSFQKIASTNNLPVRAHNLQYHTLQYKVYEGRRKNLFGKLLPSYRKNWVDFWLQYVR